MEDLTIVGKCGLFCEICLDLTEAKECRGCGCMCSECAAEYHHQECKIYQCATEKGFKTCGECPDMPCTQLIQFAYDPIWKTHLPVIENLKRIKKIGIEQWIKEQRDYWSDPKQREMYEYLDSKCGEEYNKQNK